MLLFFGSRSSKIKDRKLRRTICPYCQTQDSFVVSTFSKYFHFFWIPIIPLFKTNVAECWHCKKSYAQNEFTNEMNAALQRENETNPAKRPIWQGCGCLVLVGFFAFMFAISLYGVYMRSENGDGYSTTEQDSRRELLDNDIEKLSSILHREKDALSIQLQACINKDMKSGIDTDKIKYYTKIKDSNLLVVLGVRDLKQIEPKERKVIIDIIEDCLSIIPNLEGVNHYYIGVEGKWNTVLVKTPTDEELGGRFADKNKLLPFYGEKEVFIDSIETSKVKSDSIVNVPLK